MLQDGKHGPVSTSLNCVDIKFKMIFFACSIFFSFSLYETQTLLQVCLKHACVEKQLLDNTQTKNIKLVSTLPDLR